MQGDDNIRYNYNPEHQLHNSWQVLGGLVQSGRYSTRGVPEPNPITDDDEEQLERRLEEYKKMEAEVKAPEKKKSVFKHRFSDAPWFEWLKKQDVLLLGVGGIGSWVAFCLARIGCTIHMYDMDNVEAHNLGGQMYNMDQIQMSKVDAMKAIGRNFSGGEALMHTNGKYDENAPTNHIVISAFDNMAGRQLAFQKWCEALKEDPDNAVNYLFIDGRLLAEEYQVYAVNKDRIEAYKATLFDDSEVGEVQCSLKSTTHCSMGIASDIVSVLTNFATNRTYGMEAREVPFNISKSIPLFTYDLNLGNGSGEGIS